MLYPPNALANLALLNTFSLSKQSHWGHVRVTSGKRTNYLNIEERLSFLASEPLNFNITPCLGLFVGRFVLEHFPA